MDPFSSDPNRVSVGSSGLNSVDPPPDASVLQEEVCALYSTWAKNLLQFAGTFCSDKEAAQDAVQETFLRYFLYRSEGGAILNPKAWLFKVIRNFMLDCNKDAYRKGKVDLEEASLRQDLKQNPHVDLEHKEVFQQIVSNLALRELECIRLRMEGFDYAEIADMMEISKGTVGALITRAIQKIQKGM